MRRLASAAIAEAAGVVLAGGLVVLVGCPSEGDPRERPRDDPWDTVVTYTDPDGRFEIDFPAEPEATQDEQGVGESQLTVHALTATVGSDWQFVLAWSDAPAGTPLLETQDVAPGTAEDDAARDGGEVVDEHDVELFGRTGLEFTVGGVEASGLYHDARVVLGGRLYEWTVIQQGESREPFDRFVRSFRLLQPPVGEDADFFVAAEAACAAFFADRPDPADTATPAERGAAVREVADFSEDLVAQLETTPVSADDQGDAVAFVDSIRRSIEPARAFADAVLADSADAPELGEATHADTDLTSHLADIHDAPSCA